MKGPVWSASVMCANLGKLEEEIVAIESTGCHELHFDIMDGHFVPNFTLGFDVIKMARRCSKLPFDAHLMIERPERYIERFVEAGCTSISVHVETCVHAHRTLSQIRNAGASPGIAINPATPLTKLEYLLPYADRVLVMTVDPGYAGQKMAKSSFERVKILKESIQHSKYKARIQVDGNIDAKNGARLARHGAEIFVLGTSSIFTTEEVRSAMPAFVTAFNRERALA